MIQFHDGRGRAPNALICECGEWLVEHPRDRRGTSCPRCGALVVEVIRCL